MSSKVIYAPCASQFSTHKSKVNGHTAGDRTPYCYLIGWSEHNMWYYGRRTAEGCHPSEFWKKYKTSSDHVDEFVSVYGDPDIRIIRRVFDSAEKCARWENKVLSTLNVAKRPDFLNKSNGDAKFDNTNKVSVRDADGNTFSVDLNDPRYLSGELESVSKGLVNVLDQDCIIKSITVEEYRQYPERYTSLMSGFTIVKDGTGNTYKVSVDDPRFISGELVSITADTVIVTLNGTNVRISNTDPRYLSGELQSFNVGFSVYTLQSGEIKYLHSDDNLVTSGVVKHINTNKVMVVDGNGHSFQTAVDDPEYVNGNLKFHLTNRVFGFDVDGNVVETHKGDIRFSTGELRGATKGTHLIRNIKTNEHFTVDKDDPRLSSADYVPVNTGMTPAINKTTGETKQITVDEYHSNPDLYDSLMTGFTVVKDSSGNTYKVSVDDPRFISGELVGIGKGMVAAKTKDGTCIKVLVDDPRFLTGELVGINTGRKLYHDASGTKTYQYPTDDRVIRGELTLVDMNKEREALRQRDEVLYLKSVAKERNIRLRPSWEWSYDLTPTRELILNGPANVSYAKRK